jgi:hypothetical protein
VTKRHDSIRDRRATVLGRVNGTVEPRVLQPQDGADQRRGDIKVSKHGKTWILDVVCYGAQRYVDQGSGTTPEAYAVVKAAKYADQANFIPFILETGGRVNKAARDWLDTLTAPEPGEQVPSQDDHPWNPQTQRTTETGAGARAGPHACEDWGRDPCCTQRCRVGTVVYRDVFHADNAHEFPCCT